MLNRLSQLQASKIMLGLLTIVVLFHIFVVINLIPYEVVWAGKLKSLKEMYVFETMSITINLFLIIVILYKGNYIKHRLSEKLLNGILWFFIILFVLNTIGNLLAETFFEKVVFTPLTLLSSILLWKIVSSKKDINLKTNTK